MKVSFSLFAATLLAGVQAAGVIDLNPDNFDKVIGKGKPALVEFFAPWCGHCKNLAPIYERLAEAFSHAEDKVIIAKVDADGEGKPLGSKYGVTGFPTLKWFSADGKSVEDYNGGRELEDLVSHIYEKTGVKSNIKPPPPPETLGLDYRTFDDVVMDKSKNVLVAFTAPWCGHCKTMKPIFEQVAQNFKGESDCVLANVDADAVQNKPLAEKYGVKGFPTLKFFSKENKEAEAYGGARDEAAFISYLNEKCGTQRKVGGGLTDKAGRLAEFDSLASKFLVASGQARDSIYKEALTLANEASATSKHYVRVMEKLVNGTESYLEKESKRLTSILKKRGLSPSKLDEIKIKANILRAFAAEKAEEAEEKAESIAARATAEL